MAQSDINEHLLAWDKLILTYRDHTNEAARAENEYRRARAKFIVRARDDDTKLSQAAAETLADADDEVMGIRLHKVAAEAEAESFKQKLWWCRYKADALRSEHVDERMASQLYADRGPGA